MELHPMTYEERPALRRLYRRAFPANERFSWSQLERLAVEGKAELLCIEEDGSPAGLMFTMLDQKRVLLSYFAIFPHRRNGGVGARALHALYERCKGRPICVEIEDPDEPQVENKEQRVHRKGFYLRNDMKAIAKMHAYDAEMELLVNDESMTYEDYTALLRTVVGSKATERILMPAP